MKYIWLIFWVSGLGSLFLVFGASDVKNERKDLFSDFYGKDHSKKDFKCPLQYGTYPDPTDCKHFYVCVAGMAVRKKCQSKQHFDIKRKKCMPKVVAICVSDKTTSTKAATTTVSTKTGDDFKCPKWFGTYPHPNDCSKYYSCMGYVPLLRTCPEDQLFDIAKSSCKSKKKVDCGSRQRPGEYTSPTSTDLTVTETFSTLSTKDAITESTTEAISTTTEAISTTTEAISTTIEPISTTTEAISTTIEPVSATTEGISTTTDGISTTIEEISTTIEPISTTTEVISTTIEPISTTTEVISTTTEGISTTTEIISTTTEAISTTELRPTGPPEHNCDEDDVDCIITETGDIKDWFTCSKDIASYPHPSSDKLFIFCMNWIPSVKKCGMDRVFSTELSTCVKTK